MEGCEKTERSTLEGGWKLASARPVEGGGGVLPKTLAPLRLGAEKPRGRVYH